jgi:hypothetical protein
MVCTADHILLCDKSRKGGACGTQWVTGEVHKRFWWGNLREDLSVDRWIILKRTFKDSWCVVEWHRLETRGWLL